MTFSYITCHPNHSTSRNFYNRKIKDRKRRINFKFDVGSLKYKRDIIQLRSRRNITLRNIGCINKEIIIG